MVAHSGHPHVAALPSPAERWQGARSGLASRVEAGLIDFVVTALFLAVTYVGASAVKFLWHRRDFTFPHPSLALTITVASAFAVVYLAVGWMTVGRSCGDLALGLRIVTRDGKHPHPLTAVARAVFCVAFPVGLVWVAFDGRRRSVQDLVLRTAVIYDWPVRAS